ncbi:MAG TPA: prephenate dehydrogenase [Dehalococcoidia bacterium]|nr:prephenate dehydrogenase [Dehalococcoidia bacterium]
MRVAIIGGSGNMGRWFADFLLKDGKEVIITGRNQRKLLEAKQQLGVEVATNAEAVKSADAILISVPIANFEEVIQQLHPYISPEQVIIDIASIKVFTVEIMHKYIKTGTTLGVHPMFGPGARDIAKQNFVLTPTNEAETALSQKIRGYLETRGARVTVMTPQEHDEMMSVILGLSHFIAIVSADILLSLDNLKQLEAIGGSTYKVLLTLAGSVISEEPELYATLQMSLPNMANIEKLFQERAKIWSDLVKNKDRQEFVSRMNILKDRLEKGDLDFQKAYENMYKIVEGL